MNTKPKKTSKKKSTKKVSKKKYKGVKYIAKKLNYYFEKRYPNYTTALPRARQILESILASGKKVGVIAIFELERRKQKHPKKPIPTPTPELIVPELDDRLKQLSHYFELVDYPDTIGGTTSEIWFRSTISPSGLEDIQGGALFDNEEIYEKYFYDFVNYINSLKSLSNSEDREYEEEWFVKCTEPKFEESTGKWISLIISTDSLGIQDELFPNYGFKNDNPEYRAEEKVKTSKSSKPTEEPKKSLKSKETSSQSDIDKQIRLNESETKKLQAETEKIKAENEKTELEIRKKELDLKQVEMGIMTISEFKAKWK